MPSICSKKLILEILCCLCDSRNGLFNGLNILMTYEELSYMCEDVPNLEIKILKHKVLFINVFHYKRKI